MLALLVGGVGLLLYALLGIVGMAHRESMKLWGWEVAPACAIVWKRRLSAVSLLLFGASLLLGWATPLWPVQSVDRIVGQQLYRRGGPKVTITLKTLARLGDPNPLVYSGLWVVLTRVVRGRAHALRVFAYLTIGAYGLELCGKLLFPEVHTNRFLGQSLANSPSGAAMRAMVLALVLLVLWGPAHRPRWPRVWLRRAVVGWPILMSTAVMALRWHTLSEAIGGLLLGTAWVGLCLRLFLRHGEAGREPPMAK
jgi:hypothetical protein